MLIEAVMITTVLAPTAAIKPAVEPFPLSQVGVTGGPWKHAMDLESAYLLRLDPEHLLHGFRVNAGLPAKAAAYGGWESAGLAGHTLGHYLTACSQQYA